MSKALKVDSCRGCEYQGSDGLDRWCNKEGFSVTENCIEKTIHPNCPLPDYVDVGKLQVERDELVKALEPFAKIPKQDRYLSLSKAIDNANEALAKIKGEI